MLPRTLFDARGGSSAVACSTTEGKRRSEDCRQPTRATDCRCGDYCCGGVDRGEGSGEAVVEESLADDVLAAEAPDQRPHLGQRLRSGLLAAGAEPHSLPVVPYSVVDAALLRPLLPLESTTISGGALPDFDSSGSVTDRRRPMSVESETKFTSALGRVRSATAAETTPPAATTEMRGSRAIEVRWGEDAATEMRPS